VHGQQNIKTFRVINLEPFISVLFNSILSLLISIPVVS